MKLTDNIEGLTPLTDRERELTATIEKQNARIEELYQESKALELKAQIADSLLNAVHDDCKPDELLHMLWGFDYLLMERGPAE